ncbi:MAG: Carboxypeptidase regulatory-like domain [Thermoleophilaceae bacterium]|nr:Carboxypeptidase regulatory-like domain [Thermoleophilaceae bacterium]
MRRLLLLLSVAAALLLAPAGPAHAVKTIDIPFSEVTETYGACDYFRYYLQFGEVKGATSYEAFNRLNGGSYTLLQTGPPFPDDDEKGDGYEFKAPKGTHRFGATAGSGPGPCPDYTGAWQPDYVHAIFTDDKARIVGGVKDADGKPVSGVKISITGATSTSATTRAGVYSARVNKGRYQVRAPNGFCVTGVKKCENAKSIKVNGTEDVSFVRRNPPLMLRGTIRDEFRRGLGGVRVSVTGPETDTMPTDAGGRYEFRLQKPGTYELTAIAPKPHGPFERYFVVKDGAATDGTAADVTLNKDTSPVAVDWELDRELQFRLSTSEPALADGFSRTVATVRALTQRGDPAPHVELRIDPPVDAMPRAVICSQGAGSKPLWPSLNSDGSVSPAGIPVGPETTTDANGGVSFRIFPGTDPRPFKLIGERRTDNPREISTFSQTIPFVPAKTRGVNREQLARALFEGNAGFSFFGDESVLFETLAGRRADSDPLSGIDAVPVYTASSNRRGVLFYSRGAVPDHNATSPRVIAATDAGFVLENSLLQRVTAIPTLPTLREWAQGETVVVDGADGRTFLGWPTPTTAHGGLGTCIANGIRGERFVFTAHSPVRLLLTDKQGHRVGTDAKGKSHSEAPGTAFRDGEVSYLVAPAGALSLTVIGTGSGPVTLEARHGGATSIAQFKARKGATAKLKISNGALPKHFRFAGHAVRTRAGVPLVVKGLPKRLKRGRKHPIKLTVRDPFGAAVPAAVLNVTGATGRRTVFASGKGLIRTTLPARKKGGVSFVVSAPDLLPVRAHAKIVR